MEQRDRYRNNDERKKQQRRMLRNNTTQAEYVLWQELLLIIEVDGWVHEDEYQKEYDKRRQCWLEEKG